MLWAVVLHMASSQVQASHMERPCGREPNPWPTTPTCSPVSESILEVDSLIIVTPSHLMSCGAVTSYPCQYLPKLQDCKQNKQLFLSHYFFGVVCQMARDNWSTISGQDLLSICKMNYYLDKIIYVDYKFSISVWSTLFYWCSTSAYNPMLLL